MTGVTSARDTIVIGGGLLGWAVAWNLARAGVAVTVVDRADTGFATAAGAGIIAPDSSTRTIPEYYPIALAGAAWYPTLVADLAAVDAGETGYEQVGALFVATDDDECAALPERMALMAQRRAAGMGVTGDLQLISGQEARERFPALANLPGAIWAPGTARVNGRLLRDALRAGSMKLGARAIEGSAELVIDHGRVSAVRVGTTTMPVGTIVISGGAWSNALGEAIGLPLPVFPQRGQIIHLDLPGSGAGAWPIVLGNFSHYLLTFRPDRVVAGATRESESGYDPRLTAGGVHEVLGNALAIAPGLADGTVAEMRVGLRPYSPDGLPVIGWAPGMENVLVCTGHGAAGLQLGPYSGLLAAELLLGQEPSLDLTPFRPGRFA